MLKISGMKDKRLISIPNHAPNHDDAEILIVVLASRTDKNKIFENFMFIRIENFYSINGV